MEPRKEHTYPVKGALRTGLIRLSMADQVAITVNSVTLGPTHRKI